MKTTQRKAMVPVTLVGILAASLVAACGARALDESLLPKPVAEDAGPAGDNPALIGKANAGSSTGSRQVLKSANGSPSTTQPGSSIYNRGVQFDYFTTTQRWTKLPSFENLLPEALGVSPNFTLDLFTQKNNFGISFKALINAPRDGVYTFYTSSDDGSRLWINGALVVDNDGVHTMRERSGRVTLTTGFHNIRVDFFQATGRKGLKVSWKGPLIQKQTIPNSVLFFR